MGKWTRKFLIIPPLAIGIAIILFAQAMKSPPKKVEVAERAVKVRAIKISKIDVIPRAIGYGTMRPGRTWDAVAEILGQVSWVSDELENGHLVAAGTELLRIDDSVYRLTLKQINAQLNASRTKDRITGISIAIEERSLGLLKKDLNDKHALFKQGAVAITIVDTAQQQVYAAEVKLQNLRNSLHINVAERDVQEVQKALAEFEISKTVLRAPFDVRIIEVKANLAQFVNKGQMLFSADGVATSEVEAQFAIGKLRPLIGSAGKRSAVLKAIDKVPGALAFDAVVRLKTGTHNIEWAGRVDRVAGSIDTQTQSIGVVVAVDAPYQQAEPGKRPSLIRNTFVEVELRGQPRPGQVVIPMSALHEGRIYVLDEANRLEIRRVEVQFSQGGYTVLAKGLKTGERIVVSDLVPAVDGMLLEAVEDKKAKKRLIDEATGKEPQK